MLKELKAALKIVQEQERRKREYEALVGTSLNYKLIKDMINSALHNVVAEVILKDGSKIIFRREEDFDKLNKIRSESW